MANSEAGERIGGAGRQSVNRRRNLGGEDQGAREQGILVNIILRCVAFVYAAFV